MADEMGKNKPFCKGSTHRVIIEDVLPDVLIVCLKRGTSVYRGILLDSVKRELPCGVNFSMNALERSYKSTVGRSGVCGESESAVTPSNTPEMSALVNRHTYSLGYKSGSTQLLPEPRRDFPRPLNKNIRNMRLRPRQVLCSKCKQGIHDTPTQANPPAKSSQTQTAQDPGPLTCPKPQERYETRKRKQMLTAAASEAPQKSKRLENTNTSKSSPIIKISFAGPKGQGTIVEIPSKPNIPSDSEEGKNTPSQASTIDDEDSIVTSQAFRDNYRKFRKAQKKAEKRIRSCVIDTDMESVSSENRSRNTNIEPKRKKSKRTKHKVKRRHKHRAGKRHNSGQSEGNESFKENTIDSDRSTRTAIVVDEGEASSLVENMVMYAGEADDSDTNSLSRFCEQSEMNDDTDNRDGIIVLSPRHNFIFDCNNMKIGTPNKQYDSNTETSQELDLDFTNMPEDFFSSNKTSPNGSDSDHNLSDAPQFDLHQEDRENLDTDFAGDYTNGDDHGQRGFGPLMMRIQNRDVGKVILDDDRIIRTGDVIWGKIHGFPWWPGRILSITESLKDSGVIINQTAQISWFASSTMSHMACSELYPFLQDFKLRFNKKKKGSYKVAVKQATMLAQNIAAEMKNVTPEMPESVDVDIMDP